MRPFRSALLLLALCVSLRTSLPAQTPFAPIPAFPLNANPLSIRQPAQPSHPFSVVGERGAILGQQDGTFELWLLPVKILHNARLTARVEGYSALIELNPEAATIEVRPDHTTITYAHAAITVRQHMFIPRGAEQGLATAVVLFEVHSLHPAELTLSFEPSLERMWPAPNFGRPSGGWTPVGTGGAFTLETDNPAFFGVVAMPSATPGELRPYQERPLTTPMSFRFHYDPAHDDQRFFPLLCAVADARATGPSGTAAHQQLLERLIAENEHIADRYHATADFFAHFFDTRLTVTTPDPRFDEAVRWAEISIEQARVAAPAGTGLAGGWFTSGDSARPGFGWFFGRDTLWTLYAVNSYGDFALSREAMDFLLARQRADGKMMHEVSQMAEVVDWPHLPYLYASADSTPLFLMQMEDYVRASGDLDYLKQHWDNVERAWRFTRAHTTDGVYDNTEGTGWVEEWQPRLPHQEIYLAALDQQGTEAFGRLAGLAGKPLLTAQAGSVAAAIRSRLNSYRNGADGFYSFSRNADGSYDPIHSIFPAVAWWSGRLALQDPDPTFSAWAGSSFSTDWGTRSVPPGQPIYDPISYHHGSVWPLYTGWTSLAEYRTGRGLSAYAHLRDNMQLTWLQDPGAVTEVISGEFFAPLGRSSSHQLWSSAMVLTPAIRGLFGVEADALRHTLRVAPQLPAAWDHAALRNVTVGSDRFDLSLERRGDALDVDAVSSTPTVLCLAGDAAFFADQPCAARPETHHRLRLPLPAVEVGIEPQTPQPGSRTRQLKVLAVERAPRQLTLTVEAPAGSTQSLHLRRNGPAARDLHADGATIAGDQLSMNFGAQPGAQPGTQPDSYTRKTLVLRW